VHGNDVRMNPISGIFRIPAVYGDGGHGAGDLKSQLLDFLADEKEIYELFMVVDEELKMMCDLCTEGGQVLGPFLKPMSRLVHTEYLLAGRTTRDPRIVLRDTMYAATVTGSPVENACRLIKRYESRGRGYYGAALAVLGRDPSGGPVVDSPIVIRTADVDLDGHLTVTAGATLVRDSDAADEVAETRAKAGGILSAFGLVPPAPVPSVNVAESLWDAAIGSLESELSARQEGYREAGLAHLTVLLIDLARLAADVVSDLRRSGEPLLAEVFAVIDRRHTEPLSLRDVAGELGRTPKHLTTVVRRRTGRTVQDWIIERRMVEARKLLAGTDLRLGRSPGGSVCPIRIFHQAVSPNPRHLAPQLAE
jgi:AraC-like DNA-binding protein